MRTSFYSLFPPNSCRKKQEDIQDGEEDACRDRDRLLLARAPQSVEVEDRVAAEEFGLVAIFVSIPAENVIWSVAGLVI